MLAGELGRNAAAHVRKNYTMEQSLNRLHRVLEAAARGESIPVVRAEIEAALPSQHQISHGAAMLQNTGNL